MNTPTKYILGLAISLSLFSCLKEDENTSKPFTQILDFKQEITGLSGELIKTVTLNNKIETQTISKPNWEIELKPFLDADFNTPANQDDFTRTERVSSLTGLKDVIWVSNDNSSVKKAVYRYENKECVAAVIYLNKESAVYTHEEILTYLPNSGYSIENSQGLSNISTESFHLVGEFSGKPQPWKMYFDIGNNQIVPVRFDFTFDTQKPILAFKQGKETIKMTATKTDTGYYVEVPVFNAFLTFSITDQTMKGEFHNLDKGENYIIPFHAQKLSYDLLTPSNEMENSPNFEGKWEVYFGEGDDKSKAIGMFDRLGDDLYGTFATETGDYRFLQGKIIDDSFSLSTFDGSHLFLFTGKIIGNKITSGHFYSGSHYQTTWYGEKNNSVTLTNPDEMTSLKEGVEKIDFTFPNLNGDLVSLSNEKFNDKVVIVQILGSWCPNCMDETRYFKELYSKYNTAGLEIIGLAFERSKDFEKAKISLNKAIHDLQVPYTMLIAGTPKESANALPMITKIKSYPTSIIINKQGEVVQIHTGFYGPSTGSYYEEYTKKMDELLNQLLSK